MKPQLSAWRHHVLKDGNRFREMCETHGIYPDVNALKLWSNWLTPLGLDGPRFDTVFFVAEGNEATRIELSRDEMVGFDWQTPLHALIASASEKSRLAPPQVYECSRLASFVDTNELMKFAEERQKLGCELIFPVRLKCADGIVVIFPGTVG